MAMHTHSTGRHRVCCVPRSTTTTLRGCQAHGRRALPTRPSSAATAVTGNGHGKRSPAGAGGAVSAYSKRLKPRPCAEWWRRKRVREYVPPVTRRVLLEQVVRPQGWPEQPGSEAEAAALCREGRAEKRMPRQVCEVLVTVRLLAAPLRSYVGAHVASAFVDGPLVVIVGLMTLPVVLCSAMRAML